MIMCDSVHFTVFAFCYLVALALTSARPVPDDVHDEITWENAHVEIPEVNNDVIETLSELRRSLRRQLTGQDRSTPGDKRPLFQGDILLDREEAQNLLEYNSEKRRKKRKVTDWSLWKDPRNITIIFNSSIPSSLHEVVWEAAQAWSNVTCLKFRPSNLSTEELGGSHILVTNISKGCWGYIGKRDSRPTIINIGSRCETVGLFIHELGHSVGLFHEQSRPDRDKYIKINEENVGEDDLDNFAIVDYVLSYGVPYDLSSIMHYGSTELSKDIKKPTILTRDPEMQKVLGQRVVISFNDAKAVNKAYCNDACRDQPLASPCENGGYQSPVNCSRCLCPDGFSGQFCQHVDGQDDDSCGGVFDVPADQTAYLLSPYFDVWSQFNRNTQCSYMLRAPEGYRVRGEFQDRFGLRCSIQGRECRWDWAEVRWNNVTELGPRFCCFGKPTAVIVSTTREMLVLLRTYSRGKDNNGFMMRITAVKEESSTPGITHKKLRFFQYGYCRWKPCNETEEIREACAWDKEHTCTHVLPSLKSCWRNGQKYSCVRDRLVLSKCLQNMSECCGNAVKIGDNVCQVASTWSTWTSWSSCSARCGGCGVQTRRRGARVSGETNTRWVSESRRCNTRGCSTNGCHPTSMCNLMSPPPLCFKKCKLCCAGYKESDGKCSPQA